MMDEKDIFVLGKAIYPSLVISMPSYHFQLPPQQLIKTYISSGMRQTEEQSNLVCQNLSKVGSYIVTRIIIKFLHILCNKYTKNVFFYMYQNVPKVKMRSWVSFIYC